MPDSDTYDIWVVNDPDGPVLYFPVPTGSPAPPSEHVNQHRQRAGRGSTPDGLIEGVWERTRQRLGAKGTRLVAEIADPEVERRRAAQRAATMARGAEAAAWAPEDLLAEPEPAARPPRRTPARKATSSRTSKAGARPRRTTPKPPPAPKKPVPEEPEERMCPSCFMVRRLERFDGDLCEFCA